MMIQIELQAARIEMPRTDVAEVTEAKLLLEHRNSISLEGSQWMRVEFEREREKTRKLEKERLSFEEEIGVLRSRLLVLEREVSQVCLHSFTLKQDF